MALGETYNINEEITSGIMDINSDEYWFNTLRPYMNDILSLNTSDRELNRTIEKIINITDTLMMQNRTKEIPKEFDVLRTVTLDRNYFVNGPMKGAPEEQKKLVKELNGKIDDFMLIIEVDPQMIPDAPVKPKRIDWENGKSESYLTHNIKELKKPIGIKRIPNT